MEKGLSNELEARALAFGVVSTTLTHPILEFQATGCRKGEGGSISDISDQGRSYRSIPKTTCYGFVPGLVCMANRFLVWTLTPHRELNRLISSTSECEPFQSTNSLIIGSELNEPKFKKRKLEEEEIKRSTHGVPLQQIVKKEAEELIMNIVRLFSQKHFEFHRETQYGFFCLRTM